MDMGSIAFCGVDCSVCPDYTDARCPGCRRSDWTGGDICHPVACCRDKCISYCGECAVFPCAEMAAFYDESESHKAAYERMCLVRDQGVSG